MYQRLFIFISLFFIISSNTQAMLSQSMLRDSKTVLTGDSKEHKIEIQKLAACQTITQLLDIDEQTATLPLPAITSEQWQLFQEGLEDTPEITREKCKNKKRLRDVLTVAHYLGHTPLFDTCTTAWQENNFDIVEEEQDGIKAKELPFEVELPIAHKMLKATGLDTEMPLWIARGTKFPRSEIDITKPIWSCCKSRDNTMTAVGATDGTITVINSAIQETFCWPAHTREVSDLLFSHDNNLLFSVAQDLVIHIWDARNNFAHVRQLVTEGGENNPFAIHLNPEGTLLVADGNNSVDLWDLASFTKTSLPDTHLNPKTAIFNNTGSLIATGSEQQSVQLWNATTRQCIATLVTAGTTITRLQFNSTSTQLVAGGRNGIVYVWSLPNNELLATIPAHIDRIWGLLFSPCNKFLFSCSADKMVKIIDLETYKVIKSIKLKTDLHDMRLTSDLQLVIGSRDGKLHYIAIKNFLDRYSERKRYFERNITAAQAKLIKHAFAMVDDEDELIDVSHGPNGETFNQFPYEIQKMLLKELPFKKPKPKKKKRKTDDDDDYVPE